MASLPGRPYRATVYLPGHDEAGHGVVVAKVSAATEDGLDRVLTPWREQGYEVRAYQVLDLLALLEDDDLEDVG